MKASCLLCVAILIGTASFVVSANAQDNVKLPEVVTGVFDLGVYTSEDLHEEQIYEEILKNAGDFEKPIGCTAVAKTLDDGTTIVGRNMDYYLNNHPSFFGRTKVDGMYSTVFLTCDAFKQVTTEETRKNGIPRAMYDCLPAFVTDVMNSEGLYIEVNMRSNEVYPNGTDKFGTTGTNPESKIELSVASLALYVGQRCKSVDEAVELVKKVSWHTLGGKLPRWPLCCVMADASGHFGLLEFANNEAIWLDMQPVQANFYINKKYNRVEDIKAGLGRYELVMKELDKIKSKDDMRGLMKKLYYFQISTKNFDDCSFDVRSELCGAMLPLGGEMVFFDEKTATDDAYLPAFKAFFNDLVAQNNAMTRQEMRDRGTFWASLWSVVADCNKKTLDVIYEENDDLSVSLTPCD